MSAAPKTKRKMGITTILSTIFIVATLVWGTYSVMMIQFEEVRTHSPHEEYSEIPPWEYDINWAGGRSNWFDDINYTDLPLDQELPEDILEHLEDVIFFAEPTDPPQLWRDSAYDYYDGSSWSKTVSNEIDAEDVTMTQAEAIAQGNPIYSIYINTTVGPNIGALDMPTLFPDIQYIEDSITSTPADRILSYDLTTDDYGTLRLWPLLQGDTGETVLISYDITFTNQDMISVAANALNGSAAPVDITSLYSILDIPLTTRVTDEIALFDNVGTNAYEKAMAVEVYFSDNYDLLIDEENITIRPPDGQEITDWFIERGGGLPMDFATAYCVFMRDLNIPARITTGFSVGDIEGSYRAIKVKHMMFWVEVYIPLSTGGGEWIQVIPLALPPGMGGDELPTNVDESKVEIELYRTPSWNYTGEDITFAAMITVDDVPIPSPETISFYDNTDFVDMGSAVVDTFYAIFVYTLPIDASTGFHNITATWVSDTYSVTNFTLISAVGTSTPLSATSTIQPPDFVPSATIEVNASIGLDNYVTFWNDIVSVYGILKAGGVPVNGDTLSNNQMEIWWDDAWFGNTTILSDGSYRLNITVDPLELVRMSAGSHTVRANYTGNWEGEFLTVAPGVSDDSTMEIHALVEFSPFTVTPTTAFRGTVITYDGIAQYLNGTPLVGESIEVYLNGSFLVAAGPTNATGGFSYPYSIPVNYDAGIIPAFVNWSSPFILVNDSSSNYIAITIEAGLSDLTIDSNPAFPDPVHIAENITIFGFLRDASNGSGLVGRSIDIYWNWGNGTEVKLGNDTTIAGGYYELNYTLPIGFEGQVFYWSEFNSSEPIYPSATSREMNITVKKWDTAISINFDMNPVRVTQSVSIDGLLYLPELLPTLVVIPGVTVNLYWRFGNGTEIPIYSGLTNATGGYSYDHYIPINHPLEIVTVRAEYISGFANIADCESTEFLQVTNYDSLISVEFNNTVCHLNQTVHIYGLLQLDNGTPIQSALVDIYWQWGQINQTLYQKFTNSSGYFNFYYNCSVGIDSELAVNVYVSHTTGTPLYNSSNNLGFLTLQKYQITASTIVSALFDTVHPDEVLAFSGNFTFDYGNGPLAYATIYIHYKAANGTEFIYPKVTNSSGGFSFLYNYTMTDAIGAIYIWARFTSSNALWGDSLSTNHSLTLDDYAIELTCETANSDYFLDNQVLVYGLLTYPNGTILPGQLVTVYWDDGTGLQTFPGYSTNSSGYFNFTYSLSVSDPEVQVKIWATFNTSVNLWKNATSPDWFINTWLYDFTLSTDTNSTGGSFYLDQVVHVWGLLNYTHNGTILVGQSVTIYWDGMSFSGYLTNNTGYFNFYYNLSVPVDAPDTFNIWAEFTNSVPLWDNTDSLPGTSINLRLYGVTLNVTVSPSTVYLNGTVAIDVNLYITHNMSALTNTLVTLYWFNGTDFVLANIFTNTSGMFTFYYSEMDEDTNWIVEVYGEYNGTLLIESKESIHDPFTLERWITDISGFDTGGTSFDTTDTVIISGTLYYVDGPANYGGVWVDILVDGNPVDTVMTQSNGSFTGYWYITDPTGTYDISVRFTSLLNWIESYETTPPITVTVSAITVTWVFEITPNTTVYRSESLNVTVILTLSNGSYFANAEIYLLFQNLAIGTDFYLFDLVTTDSMGRYSWIYYLADDAPLGLTTFYTYCNTSHPLITESAAGPIAITIEQIPVSVSAIGDLSVIYLDNTLTISGTLTFGNGTPMVGHQVQIYWDYVPGPIITIIDGIAGSFSYGYYLDWDDSVGTRYYFVVFVEPTEAYLPAQSGVSTIDVYDVLTVTLNAQSTVVYMQGDRFSVTGIVTNGGGLIEGVSIQLLRDSIGMARYDPTAFDGTFSISVDTSNWPAGSYNLSASPLMTFYDLSSAAGYWTIDIHLTTTVSVIFDSDVSIMPGEEFSFSYSVVSGDGLSPVGYDIAIYLGETFVGNIAIGGSGTNIANAIIPASWTEGSGPFTIRIDFVATGFYEGSSDETTTTVHVFVDAEFTSLYPTQTLPDAPFVINGILLDDQGNAIIGRNIVMLLQNESRTEILTTDETGRYELAIDQGFPEGSVYYYRVTFRDNDGTVVVRENLSVLIQTGFGPGFDAALLMVWAVAIVIEIVIAGLLILRFKASRSGFGRFQFRSPSPTKTTSDYGTTIR